MRIASFEPIYVSNAKCLILGTMPSMASLGEGFYYAHPRNCFWPMLGGILGEALPTTAASKRAMLIKHKIALWDVAQSCEREGSLDSAIRQPRANDIGALLYECDGIGTILFNGAAAESLFGKLIKYDGRELIMERMPSTSPAYTLPYESKYRQWERALNDALSGS